MRELARGRRCDRAAVRERAPSTTPASAAEEEGVMRMHCRRIAAAAADTIRVSAMYDNVRDCSAAVVAAAAAAARKTCGVTRARDQFVHGATDARATDRSSTVILCGYSTKENIYSQEINKWYYILVYPDTLRRRRRHYKEEYEEFINLHHERRQRSASTDD